MLVPLLQFDWFAIQFARVFVDEPQPVGMLSHADTAVNGPPVGKSLKPPERPASRPDLLVATDQLVRFDLSVAVHSVE
jgi:hypothetical protein